MRMVSGIVALSILAGALVGCGSKEEVAPAAPQDLSTSSNGTGSADLTPPSGTSK